MARVNIEELVLALEGDFKVVLRQFVEELCPEREVFEPELLALFRRKLQARFSGWTHVSDRAVDSY